MLNLNFIVMESLTSLMQKEQSNAFRLYGAFFAFGTSQFQEAANPAIRYSHLGYGLYCPSVWATTLIKKLKDIHSNTVKFQVETYGAAAIIRREYFNHETQITMDRTNMLSSISKHIELYPDLFTDELIDKVCKECMREAIKNDWF